VFSRSLRPWWSMLAVPPGRPGWILSDLDTRWENTTLKGDLLAVARVLESEPSILGASAHLLGVGLKR